MKLHCRAHGVYLDVYPNEHTGRDQRRFELRLQQRPKGAVPHTRHHQVPPVQDCALYWHPDPKPGEMTVERNGRVLTCRAFEVV